MASTNTTGHHRPHKGTPEWDLWVAAIQVAIDPPLEPRGVNCQVYTRRVQALRAALEGVGIDWQKVKRQESRS